ncbi:MAG: DUF3892 domain-containing protein [Clostridia bacterium]|jgi:hypothetical protein|nr:DUF3892 domain-containing protein [Clostridia bacterium]
MIYVDKVHYEIDEHGCRVIAKMKWTNNKNEWAVNECTKAEMISFINKNPNSTKTKYLRYGYWTTGEDIKVVNNKYLRTDANNTEKDNLGELPEY